MMKRMIFLIMSAVLMLCTLGGCAGAEQQPQGTGETRTVTDHDGISVTLPKEISRIAVCDVLPLPSVLSVFFGSAEKIVAMSPTSMSAAKNGLLSELYPEICNANTTAVSGTDVNVEELMKLDPQVVFYNAATVQLGEKLRSAGFHAVGVAVNRWGYNPVETLNQWISLLSEIFPESAGNRAELVKEYSAKAMTEIHERTAQLSDAERKKVFFIYQCSTDSILTSGREFFGQFWADAAEAVNVGAELDGKNAVKVTLEQVYAWNPDVMLITNFTPTQPADLYGNAVSGYDWSGLQAVQKQQVYKMPLGMYRSFTPGADTPMTLYWLAKTIYPDLFSDVDITAKTIEYYQTVFGVQLTQQQAESIFAPTADAGKTDF